MNKTKDRGNDHPMTVDIEGLAALLSCGCSTARKIGQESGARIVLGRRVLYSVEKVRRYIEKMSE